MNKLFLGLFLLSFQSCGILGGGYGYKTSKEEESQLLSNNRIIREIRLPSARGQLLISRDLKNPTKINFVEVGTWIEEFKLTNGELAHDEVEYDNLGNIVSRVAKTRKEKESKFSVSEIWTSEFVVKYSDTLFVQHVKAYSKDGKLWEERSMLVVNHKELLSDRLKKKRRFGTLRQYDDNGNLRKEKSYN